MTQTELANLLGVTTGYICHLEKGKRGVRFPLKRAKEWARLTKGGLRPEQLIPELRDM